MCKILSISTQVEQLCIYRDRLTNTIYYFYKLHGSCYNSLLAYSFTTIYKFIPNYTHNFCIKKNSRKTSTNQQTSKLTAERCLQTSKQGSSAAFLVSIWNAGIAVEAVGHFPAPVLLPGNKHPEPPVYPNIVLPNLSFTNETSND